MPRQLPLKKTGVYILQNTMVQWWGLHGEKMKTEEFGEKMKKKGKGKKGEKGLKTA